MYSSTESNNKDEYIHTVEQHKQIKATNIVNVSTYHRAIMYSHACMHVHVHDFKLLQHACMQALAVFIFINTVMTTSGDHFVCI